MKRLIFVFAALVILLGCAAPVFAADGKVTYVGDAGQFVFAPGSEYSLTDLFPNFKDVMPGDSLTQPITVRNDTANEVKVEIYLRSLGAHEDSADLLSQLRLRVEKSEDNEMAYMFDAAPSKTAQLTDWVLLGTLYSGGEVNLNVILDVPVELDNPYQDRIGFLDWEFMVVELPVDEEDPKPPQTGDGTNLTVPIVLMILCAAAFVILLFWRRKKRGGEDRDGE